ncbi:MAG: hypothetical protein IJX53_03895 [Clostridia bacterium]|nr:hypothetical protein [Clostridia bacterium]
MSAFLNITSLILGLIAWVIPFALLCRRQRAAPAAALASGTACACAMLLQLSEIGHRVAINDYAAIADTIGAVVLAAAVLVAVTVALNAAAFLIRRK